MKAITLWQPWASLIAVGAKRYETRGWATKYRGPIAIHAAKRPIKQTLRDIFPLGDWSYHPDYKARAEFLAAIDKHCDIAAMECGVIVATARLVECWHIVSHPGTNIDAARRISIGAELDVPKQHPRFGEIIVPSEQEQMFGDWTPGRFAWELSDVKMLDKPIPARGGQGFWEWSYPL